MYSFRRFAFVLALALPAVSVAWSQESSSSSAPAAQAQPATPAENQGQQSVQARIRARREQRRAQAIRDTYGHLYEAFVGGGYLRFKPGPNLQYATMYSWDTALTRYYGEKLGVTVDARGYYGTAYVGLNEFSVTRPAISNYGFLGGPTYRFFMRPKYSLSARALGGVAIGNFSGDANGFTPASLGLYPDSTTYAISGGVVGETNISPSLSLRLSGDYYGTGFGSQMQNSVGFTYGLVYRFGRQ
jgi:hypothetical protein